MPVEMLAPAVPELPGDHLGPELRPVEVLHVDQGEVIGHACDRHRHRQMVGVRYEVALAGGDQLRLPGRDRLGRAELRLLGHARALHQTAIDHGFDIEDEIGGAIAHGDEAMAWTRLSNGARPQHPPP